MGELIGINLVKKHALCVFISDLEKSADLDYFDRAIQQTIDDGFKSVPVNIGNRFSIELIISMNLKRRKNGQKVIFKDYWQKCDYLYLNLNIKLVLELN